MSSEEITSLNLGGIVSFRRKLIYAHSYGSAVSNIAPLFNLIILLNQHKAILHHLWGFWQQKCIEQPVLVFTHHARLLRALPLAAGQGHCITAGQSQATHQMVCQHIPRDITHLYNLIWTSSKPKWTAFFSNKSNPFLRLNVTFTFM